MDFPKASLEEYLKARAKCVDDFKKTVLGHDWREEQEEEIFFNPLFQYSCGVLYPRDTKHTNINLVSENEIDEEELGRIFKSLQITVEKKNGSLECSIPSFRNDLEREVDLCEEVARVVGYNNIPSSNKFIGSFTSFTEDKPWIKCFLISPSSRILSFP